MMDAGCYCAHAMRTLVARTSPPRVVSAAARLVPGTGAQRSSSSSSVVDGEMCARLEWPADQFGGAVTGSLRASLQHDGLLPVSEIRARGERCVGSGPCGV